MNIKKFLKVEYFIYLYTIDVVLTSLSIIPAKYCSALNMILYPIGIMISISMIFKKRKELLSKAYRIPSFFMAIFFVSYVLTILLNGGDVIGNIKSFSIVNIEIMICLFFLILQSKSKRIEIISKLFSLLIFIVFSLTLLSLIMYSQDIVLKLYENKFNFEFGRYYGFFQNANDTSLCAITAFLSLLSILKTKKLLHFHILNIILQTFSIGLSDSRATTLILLGSFSITLSVHAFLKYRENIYKITMSIVSVICIFVIYSIISTIVPYINILSLNDAPVIIPLHTAISNLESNKISALNSSVYRNEKDFVTEYNSKNIFFDENNEGDGADEKIFNDLQGNENGRTEDAYESSNSERLLLLKAGLNTFLNHPILGVGSRNLPDILIIENQHLNLWKTEAGVHNSYMQILVSNGIIGFLSFYLCILYIISKQLKKRRDYPYILCFLLVLFGYMFLSSYLLFVSSITSIVFFVLLSCLYNDQTE